MTRGKAKQLKPAKATKAAKPNGSALAKAEPTNGQRKPVVTYSEEIGNIICSRLEAGESLLSVCSSDDLPSEAAVRKWAADPDHPFSPKYARAREVGWLKVGDEVLALADGLEHGKDRYEPNVIARDRLRYEARRWLLSKCLPKIYGERLPVEVSGPDGAPLQIEAAAAVRALLEAMPELGIIPAKVGTVAEPALTLHSDGEQS